MVFKFNLGEQLQSPAGAGAIAMFCGLVLALDPANDLSRSNTRNFPPFFSLSDRGPDGASRCARRSAVAPRPVGEPRIAGRFAEMPSGQDALIDWHSPRRDPARIRFSGPTVARASTSRAVNGTK